MKMLNFINGQYVEAQDGGWLDNYEPATGQVYSQLPDSGAADVDAAVLAAQKAFVGWAKTSAEKRSEILMKIAEGIDAQAEELAQAESRDVGKPRWLARQLDIPRAASNFRFFAGRILHLEEVATDMDGQALNYSLRHPMGVAGLISPWNLPLYLLTWKIAPALACGNTAVCKPSEVTSMTAYMLCEIMQKAGLPDGVCNMVFGRGETAGAPLVSHPGVPLISFTGGTATGQKVIELSAPHFKKLSLELGGKNPNIIFDSADLKKAVPGTIKSSFLNQGEICLCGSRVYIQKGIYKEFMSEFEKQVKELKVGDPNSPDSFMGPVVSHSHFEKIKKAIAQARSEGAHFVSGGQELKLPGELAQGYFIPPTAITNLKDDSSLWCEEIFGPVVSIRSFEDSEEVVRLANSTSYGLSASLWTENLSQAHHIAARLDAGTVWINTWLKRDLRVPFGGSKASGLGREGGDHSIDFYTEQKNVCVQF